MKWFRLYSDVLDDPKVQRLPPALFKTWINLLCLASQSDSNGVLPPLADLSFRLRMSDDDASTVLDELVSAGLIERAGDETFRPHNWSGRQMPSDNVTARVRKHREAVTENDDETLPQRSGNALDKNREEKKRTDTEQKRRGPDPDELRFARFWSAYPRKTAKQDAYRAWKKIKADDELTERVIASVEAHKRTDQWKRDGGQYIPHPATWLNRGQWDDELAPGGGDAEERPSLRPTDYGYYGSRGMQEFREAVRRGEIPGVTPTMVEARA